MNFRISVVHHKQMWDYYIFAPEVSTDSLTGPHTALLSAPRDNFPCGTPSIQERNSCLEVHEWWYAESLPTKILHSFAISQPFFKVWLLLPCLSVSNHTHLQGNWS